MQENRIITFANQKGGVGKTTLCTLFANYLSAKGERVHVLDCDGQMTIFNKRGEDMDKYAGSKIPYEVQPVDITIPMSVKSIMESMRKREGTVLLDVPGNLAQQGLVPIFAMSDYIVCPFQFESTSINSTATFIAFILRLQKLIASMHVKMIFVVNKWMVRYGNQAEKELWNNTEKHLGRFGLVAPRVRQLADLQRYNTIELMAPQVPHLAPTFDCIYQHIYDKTTKDHDP